MGENKTEATTETLKSALVAILASMSLFSSILPALLCPLLKVIWK